jgi:hypothetical protein
MIWSPFRDVALLAPAVGVAAAVGVAGSEPASPASEADRFLPPNTDSRRVRRLAAGLPSPSPGPGLGAWEADAKGVPPVAARFGARVHRVGMGRRGGWAAGGCAVGLAQQSTWACGWWWGVWGGRVKEGGGCECTGLARWAGPCVEGYTCASTCTRTRTCTRT